MKKTPYLVKYSAQRLLLAIITAFIILTITFFLIKLLPDPAYPSTEQAQLAFCQDQVAKGYYVVFSKETEGYGKMILQPFIIGEGINQVSYYFYRKPLISQYAVWVTNIFTKWDWGTSSAVNPNVSAIVIIGQRLVPSITINILSLVISLPLGFLFGIIAALKKNTVTDNVISTIVMIFISVPSFVIISLLLTWLGYDSHLLPTNWPSADLSAETFGMYAKACVIPVLALSFGTIAGFTRYTRAELTEVMSSEFLLLARTKGLTKAQCVVRHALRNSMVPIIPMVIGQFIGILGGSIILENLYGINGIGNLFTECLAKKDYNVLLVDMAFYTIIGLVANLLVDLSYGIVDPRIRMGAKAA